MNYMYAATPLEQAYSLYLAHQVFGVGLPLPNNTAIDISGRNAVPFLTQSGVDRGILRSFWSIADPQNFGSLTQIQQFQVILRLVAMAQSGMYVAAMQSIPSITTALQQFASQPLNLPVFSNVVMLQSNQLMDMYGHLVNYQQQYQQPPQHQQQQTLQTQSIPVTNQSQSAMANTQNPSGDFGSAAPTMTTTAPVTQSVGDAFSGMVEVQDAPLTPLQKMPEFNAASNTPTMSLSDAFAGMGPSTNSPLPTLGSNANASMGQTDNTSILQPTPTADAQDAPLTPLEKIPEYNAATNAPTMSLSDAFADMGPSTNSPLPTLGSNTSASMGQTDNTSILQPTLTAPSTSVLQPKAAPSSQGGNSGGGFGFWSLGSPSVAENASRINNESTTTNPAPSMVSASVTDDEDDDFGDFGSAPAQSTAQDNEFGDLGSAPTPAQPIAQDDDFGDFGSAPAPSTVQDDDFGDFGSAPAPATVPSKVQDDDFGDFGSAPAQSTTQDSEFGDFGSAPAQSTAQDNDFGDFGSAPSQPQMPLSQPFVTDYGRVHSEPIGSSGGTTVTGTHSKTLSTVSVSDAFGALGPIDDAPLPSLEAFGTTAAAETTMGTDPQPIIQEVPVTTDDDDDGDDGFGDFEAADETPAVTETPSASSDLFGCGQGEPTPSATTNDTFAGNDQFQQQQQQPDPLSAAESQRISVVDSGRSLSIDDAFSDMPMQQDAPLPSLESMAATNTPPPSSMEEGQTNTGTMVMDNDDHDFGNFEDARPAAAALPEPDTEVDENDIDDEFGDFGGAPVVDETPASTDEVPLQTDMVTGTGPIGVVSEPLSEKSGIGASSVLGNGHVRAMSIDDAFGDLSAPENAPLPSLEMIGASSTSPSPNRQAQGDNHNDDGDFGGFSGSIVEGDVIAAAEKSDDDDDFGGFAGAISPSSSPQVGGITSLNDDSNDDDDDEFGDFDAAPSASNTGTFPQNNDAGFSEAKADTSTKPNSSMETSVMQAVGQPLSISDAFGDMPSNDAPLPSLDMLSKPTNDNIAESNVSCVVEDENNDDFGDFESSAAIPSTETETLTAPLPSLNADETSPNDAPSPAEEPEDLFGDFGSAPEAPAPVDNNASAPAEEPEDLFGDFGSAPEASAPVDNDNPTPAEESEDLFGDFGEASAPVDNNAPAPAEESEDLFGDFGEASAPVDNNAPAPAEEPEDLFGDFGEASAPVDNNAPAPAEESEDLFGDFGEAPAPVENDAPAPAEEPEDLFGDFGEAPAPVENDAPAPAEEPEDLFGDFGEAPEASAPVDNDAPAPAEESEDLFGDFGSAPEASAPVDNDNPTPAEESEDLFGDFGEAPAPVDSNDAAPPAEKSEDLFGDFGSSDTPAPVDNNAPAPPAEPEDLFGDFGNAETPKPVEDDFGDFGNADISSPLNGDDDFGDFGSAKPAVDSSDDDFGDFGSAKPAIDSSDDDFGDFGSAKPGIDSSDDDFGGFGSANPGIDSSDDDDDWGDFETVNGPSTENKFSEEIGIRDRIRALAEQLPDYVLRKSGVSGDHVDVGELFEVNIGLQSSMTEENRRRSNRCIKVLESLISTDNSKLASSSWVQIFDVVIEELDEAKSLLMKAQSFPSECWSEIKAPLSVMAQGLAEYMRVTRSIVASIGDVLLLDESAMFTIDTWASTWCSLVILKKALKCEKRWKETLNQMKKTPLGVVKIASVEEIRSDAGNRGDTSAALCHLTLQPLLEKNKANTRAEVSLQGKCFMACSANFLANRCPFFVIEE